MVNLVSGNIFDSPAHSIAIPPLGCGLGGLSFAEFLKPEVTRLFGAMEGINITLFIQ